MTKEQAIKKIQAIIDCDLRELNTMPQHEALQNEVEALDMAIKALEQQPSDDCANRAEIIDELNRLGRNAFKDDTDYDNFFAFVDSLPPVTPTQRWIPVSERLPKESDDYLVTISIDISAKEPVREVRKDFFCILSQQWLYYNEDVIAWQPLPKTYEEK